MGKTFGFTDFLCPLVDAHVIYQVRLWEYSGLVWHSRPVTPHCQVEQDEKVVLEDPFLSVEGVWRKRVVEVAINVPAEDMRLPFDRAGMKGIRVGSVDGAGF